MKSSARKLYVLLSCTVAGVCLLSACGGTSNETRQASDAVASAQAAAVQAAADYAEAVKREPAKDVSKLELSATIGPGERVLVAGVEWKNVSGQWLSPFTQGPVEFWRGWMKCLDGKVVVGDYKPWASGMLIGEGDQCQHAGRVWRCLQDHNSTDDLAPDKAPALWQVVD